MRLQVCEVGLDIAQQRLLGLRRKTAAGPEHQHYASWDPAPSKLSKLSKLSMMAGAFLPPKPKLLTLTRAGVLSGNVGQACASVGMRSALW